MLFENSRPRRATARLHRVRRLLAIALACVAVGAVVPASAGASPATIQRSLSNMLWGPLDIVLSPVVAGFTVVNNLRDVDDTLAVQIVYTVPGYLWLVAVQAGAGALRISTGMLELVPGLVLWPIPNADLDPLYDPVDKGSALVDLENPIKEDPVWPGYFPLTMPVTIDMKFGINYTTPSF